MKARLQFIFILVVFTEFFQSSACPIFIVGIVHIVDENNKPVPKAELWFMGEGKDSSKIYRGYNHSRDSNNYEVYDYYIYRRGKGKIKRYIVRAPNFAELELTDLNFGLRDDDEIPVLKITLYSKRLEKSGNALVYNEKYRCEKKLEVKDTTVLTRADYTTNGNSGNIVKNAVESANSKVMTYPNPVKDFLKVKINEVMTMPYNAEVTDINGKLITSCALSVSETSIDMQWQTAGVYIVLVHNPAGVLIYTMKFVKT